MKLTSIIFGGLSLGIGPTWASEIADNSTNQFHFTGAPLPLATGSSAVAGFNGKLEVSGGTMNSRWGDNVGGSLSLPVGSHLGLQLDGLFDHAGDQSMEGGGAHIFWRNPQKGLLGLSLAGLEGDHKTHGLQGGLEGELYLGRFTFGANVGIDTAQFPYPLPSFNYRPVDVYATVSASYYPMDDLMVQVAGSRFFGNNLGELLLEYQTPLNGVSCFADLAKGDYGYDHVLFGLRYYFGHEKSLIRRHREDDPPSLLNRMLSSIGTYQAEYNRALNAYTEYFLHDGRDKGPRAELGGMMVGFPSMKGHKFTMVVDV